MSTVTDEDVTLEPSTVHHQVTLGKHPYISIELIDHDRDGDKAEVHFQADGLTADEITQLLLSIVQEL